MLAAGRAMGAGFALPRDAGRRPAASSPGGGPSRPRVPARSAVRSFAALRAAMPASSPGGGLKTGGPLPTVLGLARRSRRHTDCLPQQRDAGFGFAGGGPACVLLRGGSAGNPSRPRSHARRPRQGLAGLPDRLGTLEERHPGPRVRGHRAVHVCAAPGRRAGPARIQPVQRGDLQRGDLQRGNLCGFRAAGHAAAIPAGPPPDQNRPRPA